ncbi:MAG: putative metal-binding motif-containing protein, partial [Candidatus Woesearchaeota archaeon]
FDVTVFNNSCGLGCEYNHLENRCRFFIDNDNDDFGTVLSNNWVYGCGLTDGFALTGGDCNDNNPQIHPLAPEICDLQDNNCDNLIDTESDPNLTCTTKPGDLPVQNTATNVDLTFNRPYDPTLDYFYISWARIVGGLVYDGTASNRPVTNRILISLNYGETVRIRYRVHAPGPFNSLSVFYAYVNQITNGELQRVARSRNIEVHIVE